MTIVLSKPEPQITTCDKAVVKTRPIGGHTDDARHVGDGSLDSVDIGIDFERSFALGGLDSRMQKCDLRRPRESPSEEVPAGLLVGNHKMSSGEHDRTILSQKEQANMAGPRRYCHKEHAAIGRVPSWEKRPRGDSRA